MRVCHIRFMDPGSEKTGSRLFCVCICSCILFCKPSQAAMESGMGLGCILFASIFHLRGTCGYILRNKSCLFHGPEMAGKDLPGAADGPHEFANRFVPVSKSR